MTGRRSLALFFVVVFLLLPGCDRRQEYEKPLKAVRVAEVAEQAGTDAARYSASIVPYRQVTLSFRVGGYVEEIRKSPTEKGSPLLQEGDFVHFDDVLARLRETEYRARVDQARAGLAEAESALSNAARDLERAENLFRGNSMTRADRDGVRTRHEITESKVRGAGAVLEEAETALGDCRLKAPMDGVILKRLIEIGTLAGPGSPAFVLADISSVKAVFGVPDIVVEALKVGTPQSITTEVFPGERFPGSITTVSPSADPQSRVFSVEITVPNPGKRLKAGMIASLTIDAAKAEKPFPVVPLNAVVRPGAVSEGYAVFVLKREGEEAVARIRVIRPGDILGNSVAVVEGLKAGEEIVTTGAPLLVDGERVRIIP